MNEMNNGTQNYGSSGGGDYRPIPPNGQVPYYGGGPNNQKGNGAGLALGIISIVVSILGGLMFGVIGGIIGVILGAIGTVLSINVKKATNNQVGSGGFVCSLVGLAFGIVFMIGCAVYGVSCGSSNYGCYGCIGGSCFAANDASNSLNSLSRFLNSY